MKKRLVLMAVLGGALGLALSFQASAAQPTIPQSDLGPGQWDCSATAKGVAVSTGPTNHANFTVPVNSYVKGYCSAAAYVGAASVVSADGGNLASCASRDGGAVFNEGCELVPASAMYRLSLKRTGKSSVGYTSVSGTATCTVAVCEN